WVICTLWQAQYLIAKARGVDELREALAMLEWCVERADKSGVLAEQFNPYTGEPISVSPLTWSHATFVIVVLEYLDKLNQLRTAAASSVDLIDAAGKPDAAPRPVPETV